MIGHDGEAMELIAVELLFSVAEGLCDTSRNLGHAQIHGTSAGVVQEAVHGKEGFAGSEVFGWEDAVGRERAFQAEGHEERVPVKSQ